MNSLSPTILDKFCEFETSRANELFLAEPVRGVYQQFTWIEAGEQVRKMATALQAMGLVNGDKVAILSKNCAHWILADMAIAMAGLISVPLYPNITAASLEEIIIHSESKVIFVGKLDNPASIRKGIPKSLTEISFPFYLNDNCLNWDDLVQSHQALIGKPMIDRMGLCSIVYTSGTTGQPKGVMHSFHAIAFAVDAFLKNFPSIQKEIFFSYLPLCHVAERMLVESGAIYTGSQIYFVESMETFTKNLRDTKPTIFLAVPRIWEKMQEGILAKMPEKKLSRYLSIPFFSSLLKKIIRKKLGLQRAKLIFTGASPINPALLEWYARLGIQIHEAYGMTENSALSHVNRLGAAKFGTVGQTYQGVSVRLGNDQEVQVKSEANMLGYYKEPELTATCFEEGYLKTGDEGTIDEDGYLTITGRIKDQFKTSKGKYIMPAPIESKLLENSFLAQACVVGSGLPNAMALCTLTETAKGLPKEILEKDLVAVLANINQELAHFEQLTAIILLAEEWTIGNGLLTPTLKIKRKEIDQYFGERYATWASAKGQIVFA